MKYSWKYKLKCIAMECPEAPDEVTKSQFHHTIRKWVRTEEACGSEALKDKPHSKEWTPEEKYELVSKVLAGSSGTGVAIAAGINSGQLYNWIKKYKKEDVDEVKNAGLMADIKTIFERNKQIYGVRRVYRELRNRGLFANHKKIQRLMRKMGLAGKRPKQKYHSYKGEVGKVAANINSIMESFFGRLKNEMFYGHEHEFASFEDFSKAIDEYIDYYNNHRIQAKTKWMPPSVFRKASICETSY